jgi:hypothetical protein
LRSGKECAKVHGILTLQGRREQKNKQAGSHRPDKKGKRRSP